MNAPSVHNDPELLDLFIRDMDSQSNLWKPTNYWKWQCIRMQQQLNATGLAGFRRNWQVMRGVDLGPKQAGLITPPVFKSSIANWLSRRDPLCRRYATYVESLIEQSNSANDAHIRVQLSLMYHFLKKGEHSNPILAETRDSGIGEPHQYYFEGNAYSSNMLHHICLLSLLCSINGKNDYRRIIEIGGGYGALPETIIRMRRGEIGYFVCVDIPPLVYVATQYLKAVFPGMVTDYRDVRTTPRISESDITGRILVIPPWRVPALDLNFDLLWNSASFQEMEVDVIDNYLSCLGPKTPNIFINTLTEGHREGAGGQLERIDFDKLMRLIESKGYECHKPMDASVEATVYRSVLPRHSAALFCKSDVGTSPR